MDPKVLLMPVYTRGNEVERLRGALSLTRFFGAHLIVVYARSKPSDFVDNEFFAMPASVRDHIVSVMDEGAHDEEENLKQHFEDLCAQNNVSFGAQEPGKEPSATWHHFEGARSELVALRGRVSDLIIIPHSKSGNATRTFEEAILHSGRPVLLVPRGMWEFTLNNVLIGWNGGLEAARAVQQALPFLKRASSITVAASADAMNNHPTADELLDYLASHGMSANHTALDERSGSAGETLLRIASENACDFLVTGGYSHTRMRQSILGGVTSHLLKHAEMPVLMAH